MMIGYARVSTEGQTLDQQRAALKAAGCKRVFEEKASGAQRGRRELAKMLDHLQPGNVVTVTRLDRLARSTRDLLDIAERIGQAEAGLRSLAEPGAGERADAQPGSACHGLPQARCPPETSCAGPPSH